MFQVGNGWKAGHPGAHAGVLALRGVVNPPRHAGLEQRKAELEERLRGRFSGSDRKALLELPELRAYDAYYTRFKKTYHILLQVESVVFKGKSLPGVSALVEAMFMAELEDLLLTAGHDADTLTLPLELDSAKGDEAYVLLKGEDQTLKPGDMYIRDGEGIISSVIYGPDLRTRIRPETRNAVFTAYAPAGIAAGAVRAHLEHIRENVLCFAPDAATEMLAVFAAGEGE